MDKLLWIDMEMTGLQVDKERIIEVAAIVTDFEFNELESYEAIVFQDQKFIDAMDEWNTQHHNDSGLVAKIPSAPKQEVVEKKLCELVVKHFGEEPVILAGNTIAQDRRFIDAYMPTFASKLHYRMLDVTAWKIIMGPKFNVTYEKKDAHRALEDIHESIAEMRTFIQFIENK